MKTRHGWTVDVRAYGDGQVYLEMKDPDGDGMFATLSSEEADEVAARLRELGAILRVNGNAKSRLAGEESSR